ncbi:unnamed protein product [Rhodiola kirilowii]
MAPVEALYGRKCRSPICWDDLGERQLLMLEIVKDTVEKIKLIRERLRVAQSRQKSYADVRTRGLEFQVGDHVFLKVIPTKRISRFGIRGKLSSRFIGPFKILDRVRSLAYRLALPHILAGVHNVFHVSMLRKCISGGLSNCGARALKLSKKDLSYIEHPVKIVVRKDQKLRCRVIPYVKVQWSNHFEREAT